MTYDVDTAVLSFAKGAADHSNLRPEKSMPGVQVYARCPLQSPVTMSMPMSMSLLGVHVHGPLSTSMSVVQVHAPVSTSMPGARVRVRVHARVNARCPYPSYPCLGMNCLFLQNPTTCFKKLPGRKNLAALQKHLISSYSTAVSLLQPSTIDEKSTLDANSRVVMGYVQS